MDARDLLNSAAERMGISLRPIPVAKETEQDNEETNTETNRPTAVAEMVGQEKARIRLAIHLNSARDGKMPGHILFHGPPGLGKTSLAEIVAHEMQERAAKEGWEHTPKLFKLNPNVESISKMQRALVNLQFGDVLFVDECHALRKRIEEELYTALEDGQITFMSGKGDEAETKTLTLQKFVFVGATTKFGELSKPLRDRFDKVLELEYYSVDELSEIVMNAAIAQDVDIDIDACERIGERAKGTPRVALTLYKQSRDYAIVCGAEDSDIITEQMVLEAMALEDIDDKGLTSNERRYLDILCTRYKGGPTGVSNLATSVDTDVSTVVETIEPILVRLGFMERKPRGRVATDAAYEHLGLPKPAVIGW